MRAADLKLGFVGSRSGYVDPDGNFWTDPGIGRLLEALAARTAEFTLALSLSPEKRDFHSQVIPKAAQNLIGLPWMPSLAGGIPKAVPSRRVIRQVEERSDVLIVQLPFDSPLALLRPQRPRVYHLCADIVSMARDNPTYCGYKRGPALLVGRTIDQIYKRLLRRPGARVVTNGQKLFKHYGAPGRAVVSTSIVEREIMSVTRTRPPDAPFRILFVGFLRQAKGIDTLLDAYARLIEKVPGAELLIAGDQDKIEPEMMGYLERKMAQLEGRGHIQLLGRVEFGPQLFQQFADADVLALPSRSEGTPRVLIEARAFGCPVVSTTVGGIPTSVTHEVDGLLVPPNEPAALSAAILRVVQDVPLRQRLIQAGLDRARRSTIESFAETMIDEALELVGGSDPRHLNT